MKLTINIINEYIIFMFTILPFKNEDYKAKYKEPMIQGGTKIQNEEKF